MRKAILKFARKMLEKPMVKLAIYILGLGLVFLLYGVFDGSDTIYDKIMEMIKNEVTLSVFFVGILSVLMTKIVRKIDWYLEESQKITDDHHDVIIQYSGHKGDMDREAYAKGKNYADEKGVHMSLRDHVGFYKEENLKNKEKDIYSKKYKKIQEHIDGYRNKKILYLPTVNVFTNYNGKTTMEFEDKKEMYQIPEFVVEHAPELMEAHRNSMVENNRTIRLGDFAYDADSSRFTLKTMRSTYFHMLITNRCMDYAFSGGMTVRRLYEYGNTISPLSSSVLSNQIGINGFLITSDGYLLVEKRDHTKITWKNKFAQSISLAMRKNAMDLDDKGLIKAGPEAGLKNLENIIWETMSNNHGLTREECEPFSIEQNFLGLARDLLEGGKPNLYFYAVTKYTAKELAEVIKKNVGAIDKNVVELSKLKSDFYLIPYQDIQVNYHYKICIDRSKCIRVRRHVAPRDSKWSAFKEVVDHKFISKVYRNYTKECGEAFLASLSYLEICEHRIPQLNQTKR